MLICYSSVFFSKARRHKESTKFLFRIWLIFNFSGLHIQIWIKSVCDSALPEMCVPCAIPYFGMRHRVASWHKIQCGPCHISRQISHVIWLIYWLLIRSTDVINSGTVGFRSSQADSVLYMIDLCIEGSEEKGNWLRIIIWKHSLFFGLTVE